jgi:hypothetical protein
MKAAAKKKAREELGDLTTQLAEVAKLKGAALQARYEAVLGHPPKSKNQGHLRKRIAIELQCKASGHPTPEEKARIGEVQTYALEHGLWPDLRKGETTVKAKARKVDAEASSEPAPAFAASPDADRDPRLPPIGTVLTKQHGNQAHKVTVLAGGFEYRGETHRSLSKVARLITGTTWNGFLFFALTGRK